MKFVYLDESGLGEEPYCVLAGVVVDAARMAPTKDDWSALIQSLEGRLGRCISELHTRDLYPGNGPWRGLSGDERSEVIDRVFEWLASRKHHVVFSAVDRRQFHDSLQIDERLGDVGSDWRLMGLHIALAIQKRMQREKGAKGHTVLIFDNREVERRQLTDLLLNPPAWIDTYYARTRNQKALDQIVDVPHFVDSKHVGLVQLADFVSFFLRKHLEIQEKVRLPDYAREGEKLAGWVQSISARSIGRQYYYPSKERCNAAELIYAHAPRSATSI